MSRETGPAFLLGGIQIREPDVEDWVATLQEVGFNTISVTVYARQGRWDGPELTSDAESDWVIPEIRAAKSRGLRVVLILRLALEHAMPENLFLWHGMIMPKSEADLDAWFEAYGRFVRRWAGLAEAEGVDVLGIGSELNALASTVPADTIPNLEAYYLDAEKQLEERERMLSFEGEIDRSELKAGWGKTYDSLGEFLDARSSAHRRWAEQVTFGTRIDALNLRRQRLDAAWRTLIDEVREVYGGKLTYAANFDQYQMVGFWDALDFIGVNAYFPLRRPEASSDDLRATFEDAWSQILEELSDFRRRRDLEGRSFLFTELGYTFRADSTLEPWAGGGFDVVDSDGEDELRIWQEQPVDYAERAAAVGALRTSLKEYGDGLLHGLLYWKFSTQPSHREIEPFVLIVGPGSEDPLQGELLGFLDAD